MENKEWKGKIEECNQEREELSVYGFPSSVIKVCSACGAQAQRAKAKFCLVCGKLLLEDYQPLDSLKSSYRLQGKPFPIENPPKEAVKNLFEEDANNASDAAKAFVVYSLVPYLGILFCPLALLSGSVGIVLAYRKPYLGGAKTSVYSIIVGAIIFAVQILLWWLLYIIPERFSL